MSSGNEPGKFPGTLNRYFSLRGIKLELTLELDSSSRLRFQLNSPNNWFRYLLSVDEKIIFGCADDDSEDTIRETGIVTLYKYIKKKIFNNNKQDDDLPLKFVYEWGMFGDFTNFDEDYPPTNSNEIALVYNPEGPIEFDIVLTCLPDLTTVYEKLPDELIFEISLFMEYQKVLHCLARVNKRMYGLLGGKTYFQSLIKMKCKEYKIQPPNFQKLERSILEWKKFYETKERFSYFSRQKFVVSSTPSHFHCVRFQTWYKFPVNTASDWCQISNGNVEITKDVKELDEKVRFQLFFDERYLLESNISLRFKLRNGSKATILFDKDSSGAGVCVGEKCFACPMSESEKERNFSYYCVKIKEVRNYSQKGGYDIRRIATNFNDSKANDMSNVITSVIDVGISVILDIRRGNMVEIVRNYSQEIEKFLYFETKERSIAILDELKLSGK